MAFRLEVTLEGCEFRARSSRTVAGSDGKSRTFRSIRVEDYRGEPIEIGVRDDSLWESCLSLAKGDFVNLPILAMATSDYNFVNLVDEPERVPDPTEA